MLEDFAMVKSIVFVVICLLVLLGVAYGMYRYGSLPWLHPEKMSPVQTSISMPSMLIHQIQNMGELHTASTSLQTIISGEQRLWKLWIIPAGRVRILFVAVTQVRAGIDLSKLNAEDLVLIGNRLEINLPPVELLDIKLDIEKSEIYDVRKSIFLSPDSSQLHQQLQKQALEKARENALSTDILLHAEKNAITKIQSLYEHLDYDVVVRIRE